MFGERNMHVRLVIQFKTRNSYSFLSLLVVRPNISFLLLIIKNLQDVT